jgi:CheY-specific phosphatase CheX
MNTNLLENDLKLYIDDTVISVFDTMLAMELRPSTTGAFFRTNEMQVIGMVGLAGKITALVCLRVSETFSHRLACAMMGLEADESLSDPDVNDVIGELANITAGKLKSCLRVSGGPCNLSLPTIVRGHTIEMESMSGTHRRSYTFRHGDEPIVVEFYSQHQEEAG